MNDLDQYPILTTVRRSGCPTINWLLKPGESVQYFKLTYFRKDAEWHERWEEITAGRAYEIAERYDRSSQKLA